MQTDRCRRDGEDTRAADYLSASAEWVTHRGAPVTPGTAFGPAVVVRTCVDTEAVAAYRGPVDTVAALAAYDEAVAGVAEGYRQRADASDRVVCTLELAWAGHTEQSAWRLIRGAHAAAMTKARGTRYQWWSDYVWTRAVQDRDAFAEIHGIDLEQPEAAPRPVAELSTTAAYAVAAARGRLQELLWRQPTRARAALGLVGHTILDRISRTADADAGAGPVLRVPCPERDLALDTGISDRKTIRTALRLLDGTVGALHRDGLSHAHALRASTSYEFSIAPAIEQGVREIPPPKAFHPPRGLWGSLPRSAHALWRALLQGGGEGSAIAQLAIAAALVPIRGQTPTRSQLDTTVTGLQALSRAGLARETALGPDGAGSIWRRAAQ